MDDTKMQRSGGESTGQMSKKEWWKDGIIECSSVCDSSAWA